MHLYNNKGKPVYEVPYANKKGMRKATLKDARKLGLYPSVTEVLNILDKPGLNIWKENQVLESALTLTRDKNDSDKSFIARIKKDAKELSLKARNKGTDIHNALEKWFDNDIKFFNGEYFIICQNVEREVNKYFNNNVWITEKSYSNKKYGYGGKIDLIKDRGTSHHFRLGETF